ncbi:MAG: hypothetical protein JWN46_2958 [Acidimicrobiales bacterium]|nr:hypothetical protein [Acidimicrobiales bacterium]
MALSPTLADPGADDHEVSRTTNAILKGLAVVVILGLVGFWAWIFAGGPERANPDHMDDSAYVKRTSARCDAMNAAIGRLPPAMDSRTAGARADVVDRATAIIARTVDAIEADAPKTGADHARTAGWIADWRTYLANRADYTVRLRQNPRAQLLFDKNRAGDPIDQPIKNFADINNIPSCDPPGDIG